MLPSDEHGEIRDYAVARGVRDDPAAAGGAMRALPDCVHGDDHERLYARRRHVRGRDRTRTADGELSRDCFLGRFRRDPLHFDAVGKPCDSRAARPSFQSRSPPGLGINVDWTGKILGRPASLLKKSEVDVHICQVMPGSLHAGYVPGHEPSANVPTFLPFMRMHSDLHGNRRMPIRNSVELLWAM